MLTHMLKSTVCFRYVFFSVSRNKYKAHVRLIFDFTIILFQSTDNFFSTMLKTGKKSDVLSAFDFISLSVHFFTAHTL